MSTTLRRPAAICEAFYRRIVRPALESAVPGLPHAAALVGRGSEVQGFDDALSTDHNCEARVTIFLTDDDHARYAETLRAVVGAAVPDRYAGRPTLFEVTTIGRHLQATLGLAPDRPVTPADWLTFGENNLRMVTCGPVFADDIGLRATRERFGYYPRDVWLYLMIAAWWRIHPEVNLVGRAASVGDELGSSLIGSSIVRGLMQLCFLLDREYAPYSKWFGTAFSRLPSGATMTPLLLRALRAPDGNEREEALIDCYRQVALRHQQLAITRPVPTGIVRLWDRPFRVLWGDFPAALRAELSDPEVIAIADRWPVGMIDGLREVIPTARHQHLLAALVGGAGEPTVP